MKTYRIGMIILAAALCAGPSGYAEIAASKGPVLLEIIDGDTAFAVNKERDKAWWLVGECRREIPIQSPSQSSKEQKAGQNTGLLLSRKITDNVTIGRRQIALTQQFRFDLTSAAATVEVYNSVRGGWASVPVRENASCHLNASCLAKMELPDC